MAKGKQEGLGDELFVTRLGEFRDASGPLKGEFVPPTDISETKEIEEAISKSCNTGKRPLRAYLKRLLMNSYLTVQMRILKYIGGN